MALGCDWTNTYYVLQPHTCTYYNADLKELHFRWEARIGKTVIILLSKKSLQVHDRVASGSIPVEVPVHTLKTRTSLWRLVQELGKLPGLHVKRTWEWTRTLDLVLGWPALLAGARQIVAGGESTCTPTWLCRKLQSREALSISHATL